MGFWRVLYRCGRTIGHLTVGECTVTGVPLFLLAFLVSSCEMDGKAERRWPGTSPCDNERTIALRKNAVQAYEGKSSELIPPARGRESVQLGSSSERFSAYCTSISIIYICIILLYCTPEYTIQVFTPGIVLYIYYLYYTASDV